MENNPTTLIEVNKILLEEKMVRLAAQKEAEEKEAERRLGLSNFLKSATFTVEKRPLTNDIIYTTKSDLLTLNMFDQYIGTLIELSFQITNGIFKMTYKLAEVLNNESSVFELIFKRP